VSKPQRQRPGGSSDIGRPRLSANVESITPAEEGQGSGGGEAGTPAPRPRGEGVTYRTPADKARRTYYLPKTTVTELDRAVTQLRADAYVERAPDKSEVVAEVIAVGLAHMPEVLRRLRAAQSPDTT
jgi:hypothetical protein